MDDNHATGRGRRNQARRAVIGGLAGPAALILLSACGGSHGTITRLTAAASTTATTTASATATASTATQPPRAATDPPATDAPSATAPSTALTSLGLPPKGPVLIAAPAANGVRRLLTVSTNGKVSMSGTTPDDTTRLVLRPATTSNSQYLIMSPQHSEEKDAYCLTNAAGTGGDDNPEGTFGLAVCDRRSLSQLFTFSPSYEGDGFVIAAPYGTIMAKGSRAYSVVSENPTHFTVSVAS